jgi:fructoselysine-6-P-deglycase FrlB-like protein
MPRPATFEDAIASQPAELPRIAAAVDTAMTEHPVPRWNPGDSVAVLGMGASLHASQTLVHVLRDSGIRASAISASELLAAPSGYSPADHVVVISESGRSPEPIRAVQYADAHRIAVTDLPDSPLADVCDLVIPLGGIADSAVYTLGFTGTLLACARLAAAATGRASALEIDALCDGIRSQLSASVEDAVDILSAATLIDLVAEARSMSAAGESALMLRESLSRPASAFETFEYLHGPRETLGPDTALVVFGEGRETALIADALRAGAAVLQIVDSAGAPRPADERMLRWVLPTSHDDFSRSIHQVVAMQTFGSAGRRRPGRGGGAFRPPRAATKVA